MPDDASQQVWNGYHDDNYYGETRGDPKEDQCKTQIQEKQQLEPVESGVFGKRGPAPAGGLSQSYAEHHQ
jgi:hypothetical protein